MRESPDRCNQNFGSESKVKEEAKFKFNFADFFLNFSNKQNIIKCLENMYSFYEIFPDRGDLGVFFFVGWGSC